MLSVTAVEQSGQNIAAQIGNQGGFLIVPQKFDFYFTPESSTMVWDLFDVKQLAGTVCACVLRPFSGVMLPQPAERVCAPAGVIVTVRALDDVAIVSHGSPSGADEKIDNRHQRAADDDAEKVEPDHRTDKNQGQQDIRTVLSDRLQSALPAMR